MFALIAEFAPVDDMPLFCFLDIARNTGHMLAERLLPLCLAHRLQGLTFANLLRALPFDTLHAHLLSLVTAKDAGQFAEKTVMPALKLALLPVKPLIKTGECLLVLSLWIVRPLLFQPGMFRFERLDLLALQILQALERGFVPLFHRFLGIVPQGLMIDRGIFAAPGTA